jgi:hypothetical protein
VRENRVEKHQNPDPCEEQDGKGAVGIEAGAFHDIALHQ